MIILRKNRINKFMVLFVLLAFLSCNSLDNDEYKILNLALNKCVFKEIDPKEVSKTADEYKISLIDAMNIVDSRIKKEQYTFTMSDTLYAVDLPKDIWEGLHNQYVFDEIKNRSDKSIPIDFTKIEDFKNIKRVVKAVNNKNYLGHFKFHRILFDKSKERAYIQIDLPSGRSGFGSIGLRLKKENGEWKFENQL